MARKSQSGQEALMKTYCGRCMSAPFVFLPDLWKLRPTKTREPADLVWACNNCVTLMYLTKSKLYETEDKNKSEFFADMDHNLTQAKSAIKHWTRHAITGENLYHRFWLDHKTTTRVAVLSLIKTGDSFLSFDKDDHAFIEVDPDLGPCK